MSIPQDRISGDCLAERIETSRQREAMASIAAGAYKLLSHDMAANVAVIQRKENPDRTYRVNYLTGECQCKDYETCIRPMNRRLAAMGSDKRLTCKHESIAFHLAFADAGTVEPYADFMDDPFPLTCREAEADCRQALDVMVWQVLWGGVA